MNDIVRVFEADLDGETVPACDARELHEFLEVRTRFGDWIVRRIEDAQLVDGVDFLKFEKISETKPTTEYALSLDAGKHIAMLERNDKGRQVREYFIQYEKRHRSGTIVPRSPMEMILAMAQAAVEQERRQQALETRQNAAEDRIQRIEARQEAAEKGISYFSVIAFARYKNLGPIDLVAAQGLGRQCSELCREQGIQIGKVRDPRFGIVNSYPEAILETVFDIK